MEVQLRWSAVIYWLVSFMMWFSKSCCRSSSNFMEAADSSTCIWPPRHPVKAKHSKATSWERSRQKTSTSNLMKHHGYWWSCLTLCRCYCNQYRPSEDRDMEARLQSLQQGWHPNSYAFGILNTNCQGHIAIDAFKFEMTCVRWHVVKLECSTLIRYLIHNLVLNFGDLYLNWLTFFPMVECPCLTNVQPCRHHITLCYSGIS